MQRLDVGELLGCKGLAGLLDAPRREFQEIIRDDVPDVLDIEREGENFLRTLTAAVGQGYFTSA